MTIRYRCSECQSILNIKDELAGTKGKCPKCKKAFVVPAATDGADESGKSKAKTKSAAAAKTKAGAPAAKADKPTSKATSKKASEKDLPVDMPTEVTNIDELDKRGAVFYGLD